MCGCSLATAKRRIAEAEAVVRQHVATPESRRGGSVVSLPRFPLARQAARSRRRCGAGSGSGRRSTPAYRAAARRRARGLPHRDSRWRRWARSPGCVLALRRDAIAGPLRLAEAGPLAPIDAPATGAVVSLSDGSRIDPRRPGRACSRSSLRAPASSPCWRAEAPPSTCVRAARAAGGSSAAWPPSRWWARAFCCDREARGGCGWRSSTAPSSCSASASPIGCGGWWPARRWSSVDGPAPVPSRRPSRPRGGRAGRAGADAHRARARAVRAPSGSAGAPRPGASWPGTGRHGEAFAALGPPASGARRSRLGVADLVRAGRRGPPVRSPADAVRRCSASSTSSRAIRRRRWPRSRSAAWSSTRSSGPARRRRRAQRALALGIARGLREDVRARLVEAPRPRR